MIDQRMTGLLIRAGLEQTARSSDPCQRVYEGNGLRVVLTLLLGGGTEAEVLRSGRIELVYSADDLKAVIA